MLTGGAGAIIAVLAVTGVVALSTSGSASPRAKDAAATTAKEPHYLLPIAALVQDGTLKPPTLAGDTGSVGVPKGTTARPTTAPATPNPDSSNIGTFRGSAGTMTPAGIATLALERGCSAAQAPIATAVAMAESGGSPSAQGDVTLMTSTWDWSAGLWQIRGLRSQRGTGQLRDSIANQRAATNSAAMYVISSSCTNWTPWTTYTRGLYLGYMGLARQAVNYVLAYYKKHGSYPPVAAPDPTAVIPVASGGGAGAPAPGVAAAGSSKSSAPAKSKSKPAGKPSSRATSSAAAGGGGGGGGTNQGGGSRTTAPNAPATSKASLPTKLPTKLPLPTSTKKHKTATVPVPVPVTTCVIGLVCVN
ncbi:hypothetical protein [uncultured Jatrophihabitans sp.]|uniref:hypothetical protein n=1 Tax=uncultured Jatrophihabitans sp. TaxID=1610747 RepID=UPI0035CA2E63